MNFKKKIHKMLWFFYKINKNNGSGKPLKGGDGHAGRPAGGTAKGRRADPAPVCPAAACVAEHRVRLGEGLADPDDETKLALAKRFGVTMDYLLGLSDRREPPADKGATFIFIQDLPPAAERELGEFSSI